MFLRGGAGLAVAFAFVFVLLVPVPSAQAAIAAACPTIDVTDAVDDQTKPANQGTSDTVTGFDQIDIVSGCIGEDETSFGVVMVLSQAPAPNANSQTWTYTVTFKNATGADVTCRNVRGQTSPGTTGCAVTLTGSTLVFVFPRTQVGASGSQVGDLVLSSSGVFVTSTGAVLTSTDRAPNTGVAFPRATAPYVVGLRAPATLDSDADGVPDRSEIANGTDPASPDSDHDGLLDGASRSEPVGSGNATNLTRAGIHVLSDDGSTITFAGELEFGTNATDPDTDGDGLLDGPNVRTPTGGVVSAYFGNESLTPISSDGTDDLFLGELEYGANPMNIDTDADGLTDREEVTGARNTAFPDTAFFPEFPGSTNPANADSDGDGLSDAEELDGETAAGGQSRTFPPVDPNEEDTDRDGLTDYEEVMGRTEVDGREVIFEPTDPTVQDSDGDGANDYDEVRGNTDPRDPVDKPGAGDQPGGAEASYLVLSTIAMLVVILLCVIGIVVRWG